MMNRNEAKELVERKINEPNTYFQDKPKLVIIDDMTIEKDWGWVFFYSSEEYIKTGDIKDAIAGNAPYIVNRETGAVEATGSAMPIEEYILEYEAKL